MIKKVGNLENYVKIMLCHKNHVQFLLFYTIEQFISKKMYVLKFM